MPPTQSSAEDRSIATITSTDALLLGIVEAAPVEAVKMLQPYPSEFAVQMLELLNPALAQDILACFPSDRRQKVLAAASPALRQQWMRNEAYPEHSIGHMMEPPLAVFRPEATVAQTTEELRHFVTRAFITYAFVVDEHERLLGVVAMRECSSRDRISGSMKS